jgi:hypothetical protein
MSVRVTLSDEELAITEDEASTNFNGRGRFDGRGESRILIATPDPSLPISGFRTHGRPTLL